MISCCPITSLSAGKGPCFDIGLDHKRKQKSTSAHVFTTVFIAIFHRRIFSIFFFRSADVSA